MGAITICSGFGTQKNGLLFPLLPHLFAMKWWDWMPWSQFFHWVFNQLFHSPVSLSSRGSLVLLHVLPQGWCHLCIRGYWYFSWQSWFQLVLPPAWHLADVLCIEVKQGDNIQPWCIPFPNNNQSVQCPDLTVASWPAYRFLKRQVR